MRRRPKTLSAFLYPLLVLRVSAAVIYVDANSPQPTAPYTNWETAARVIQDAVDVALAGDQVLVTNGVYGLGGRPLGGATNRVAVNRAITIHSVNGPTVTSIEGYQEPPP